jgi:hypothetical protein
MFRPAVIAALFILSLAACGGKEDDRGFLEGAAKTETDTATHPASPGGEAVIPSTASGTTVLVTLEDNRIVVADADRIPVGPAIFTITNTGSAVHSLYIEGPGVNKAPDVTTIAQGSTTSVNATLQQGSYTLYCPITGHRENGEAVTLIIKAPTAPGSTSTISTTGT